MVDAANGSWIKEARLRIADQQGDWTERGRAQGWGSYRRYGEGDLFSWEVRAPGYRTRRGDLTAFDRPMGRGWRSARVLLSPE